MRRFLSKVYANPLDSFIVGPSRPVHCFACSSLQKNSAVRKIVIDLNIQLVDSTRDYQLNSQFSHALADVRMAKLVTL